jgi:hypothetical protein
MPAAFGERKIDRTTTEETALAWIGASLEQRDCEAALGEQSGEQGADQSGTDNRDFLLSHFRKCEVVDGKKFRQAGT